MNHTLVTTFLFALPIVAFAAAVSTIFNAESLIFSLLAKFGYLLWIATVMFFFWGLVKFINNVADTKEHEEGKKFLVWGLISFLVLFSIWGLVKLTFDSVGIVNPNKVCYIDKSGAKIDGSGGICP